MRHVVPLWYCVVAFVGSVDISGTRLYADVLSYTVSGEHRTGTPGLDNAMNWFESELRSYGYSVQQVSFDTQRSFEFERCELELDISQAPISCFPVWLPSASIVSSVPLTRDVTAARGKAVVLNIPGIGLGDDALASVNRAVDAGAVAVLIVNSPSPGQDISELPVALNRDITNASTWSIPVVIIGSAHNSSFTENATLSRLALLGEPKGNTPTHILHAQHLVPDSFTAQGDSEPIVIVEVGLSGWHVCGGERGPGVALGLGLARWHAERIANGTSSAQYHFFATCGHEFGSSFGLPDFFGWLSDKGLGSDQIAAWLHTGSVTVSYAAFDASGNGSGVQFANCAYSGANDVVSSCVPAPLRDVGYTPLPASEATRGGVSEIVEAGYPAFGFWGDFPRFHRIDDDATSVGPELLEPVAKAFVEALQCIEGGRRAIGSVAI